MLALWAPADAFTSGLNVFLLPLKHAVSYLYEHTFVLALIVILSAAVIAAVETLKG